MLMYHGHLQLKIIRKNMGWQLQFLDLAVCYSFFKKNLFWQLLLYSVWMINEYFLIER